MIREFNTCAGSDQGSHDWYAVEDPALLLQVGEAPLTSERELDNAVDAANDALKGWRQNQKDRCLALEQCAELLSRERDRLAELLSKEQGKPLPAARKEILSAQSHLEYYAAKMPRHKVVKRNGAHIVHEVREPIGVAGLIVPWNFPVSLLTMKLGPALWLGNTVIVKPAPTTPLTTLAIASLFRDCLPPGVMNTVTGDAALGARLVAHEGVHKISFTGSTPTGRKIMACAAPTLKRVSLELGGNDAAIVLPDVDIRQTAQSLFPYAFNNAGQVCAAIKRLYVHRSIADDLVTELASIAAGWRVGPGMNEGVQMGPVHNRSQLQHVQALLDDAVANGARMAAGGTRPNEWPGHFLRPTVVTDVKDDCRLVREEQFGPALPVLTFEDEDDAIARANDSEFGLGGSVWARDTKRAASLAGRIEAVNLFINQHVPPPTPEIPFGGMKASGFGYEFGEWGLDDLSTRKILHEPHTPA